jgi:MOSC domain-containing protein YiiM
MGGQITAVSSNGTYSFTKPNRESITLLAGLGVEGDVHAGVTVKHRSRVARDPSQPNLRQVHLLHQELFDEVREAGIEVAAGELGENVTTRGIDLLVEVTGLRNPCLQIDNFRQGLLRQVVTRDAEGKLRLKGGIMSVVLEGGVVRPGDGIEVELPDGPHVPLEIV